MFGYVLTFTRNECGPNNKPTTTHKNEVEEIKGERDALE